MKTQNTFQEEMFLSHLYVTQNIYPEYILKTNRNKRRQQHDEKNKGLTQVLRKERYKSDKHMKKLPIFLPPPPTHPTPLAKGIG